MVKKISLSVSESQFSQIKTKSEELNITMTDFIISNLPIVQDNKLSITTVETKINSLECGKTFSIPSLFSKADWDNFEKGSRPSVGRLFYKKVIDVNDSLSKSVKFLKKNSANLAIYEKIK